MSIDGTLVETEAGQVRGKVIADRVTEFRNIPYAAGPVGDLRFQNPQPAARWTGELDATAERGPNAPQSSVEFDGLDIVAIAANGWRRGDDFLTLNVWTPTPALTGRQQLPVMVWIHGGAFVNGDKDLAVFRGAHFARDGVVMVAINYRLGVEGFIAIDGVPTNLGLRDQIAALAWVRRNIIAFGGNPDNITIMGESAGGMSVACLVASPLAAGLFHRAIAQSGAGSTALPIDIAQRASATIAKNLGISADAEGFRSRPPEDALQAMGKALRFGAVDLRDETGFNAALGFGIAGPVFGDDVLPHHPLTLLQQGGGRDVDLMMSTTAEESNFFVCLTPLRRLPRPAVRWFLRRVHPQGNEVYDAYARQNRGRRASAVLSAALTDLGFRWPARQFAEAHQGRAFVYEFDWLSPAAGGTLGAAHAADLGFTFDALPLITGPRRIGGETPPQQLATHLHDLLIRFATDGTVRWPQFDPVRRQVYQLTTETPVSEPELAAAAFLPSLADRAVPPTPSANTPRSGRPQ